MLHLKPKTWTLPCEFQGKPFKGMEKTQTCKGRIYTLFISGVNRDMEVKILCRIVQPESTAHMLWCVGKWGWRLKRVDWGYAVACFGYRIILSCPKSAFFACMWRKRNFMINLVQLVGNQKQETNAACPVMIILIHILTGIFLSIYNI